MNKAKENKQKSFLTAKKKTINETNWSAKIYFYLCTISNKTTVWTKKITNKIF